MISINYNSIEKKIQAWESSTKGKKQIQNKAQEYSRKNINRTESGSVVTTKKDIMDAADVLIMLLKDYARSYSLPDSVIAHFDSLSRGAVMVLPNGSFMVEVGFTDDLSRPSLQPSDYDGVKNIVALFNNGYPADSSRSKAISYVSGWWHDKYTNALPSRPALHFMQAAVSDFNNNYASSLGIHAELNTVYKS